MTPETLHPCAHRIALTYPFTEHCWPFGPEYDVFKVDGRIFMITMTIRGRALVNLKAEPQKSLLNQQIYRSIEPGYHMNKTHWNTVTLNAGTRNTGSRWCQERISARICWPS